MTTDATHPPLVSPGRRLRGADLAPPAALLLTALADHLVYGHRPGWGLAIFALVLWAALWLLRPPAGIGRCGATVLSVLFAGCALGVAIAPNPVSVLLGAALLCHAIGTGAPHRWRRLVSGLLAAFWIPGPLRRVCALAGRAAGAVDVGAAVRSAGPLARGVRIAAPALVLLAVFAALLGGGNAVVGKALTDGMESLFEFITDTTLPEPGRVAWWGAVGLVLMAVLANRAPLLAGWFARGEARLVSEPRDLAVAVWRARLVLVGANALFLFANGADLLFLWGAGTLPEGVSYSHFVHRGTYNLIACTVLAGVVLAVLCRRPAVAGARGQRVLAALWILQNLALVAGVGARLHLYVEAYGMSVLRVHVALFLCLVACGFLLLLTYVWRGKPIGWLFSANGLAVFALFYGCQFLNVRGFVADWNVRAVERAPASAPDLDIGYLEALAPESWPALERVASQPGIFRARSGQAAAILARAASEERARDVAEGWRGRSWRRASAMRALPAPAGGGQTPAAPGR